MLCVLQILMAKHAQSTEPSFRDSALQCLDGLYGYAMTLTHNQAEAEDLVQDTYLRAMRAFERLRPEADLKSWLFTILRNIRSNQIRDGLRKSRSVETYGPSSTPELEEKSSKDPLFLYLAKVRQADVRKAIKESGTVMSRLKRAGERLKELLRHWTSRPVRQQARRVSVRVFMVPLQLHSALHFAGGQKRHK